MRTHYTKETGGASPQIPTHHPQNHKNRIQRHIVTGEKRSHDLHQLQAMHQIRARQLRLRPQRRTLQPPNPQTTRKPTTMIRKTTDEIRTLVSKAKLDFESVQNEALNAYLLRLFQSCPLSEDVCSGKQCIECPVFKNSMKK